MPKNFRERFLAEAGEKPYAWAVAHGLSKDLVTAVMRGADDYQPIRRTLDKIAQATGKSVVWWLNGGESEVEAESTPQGAAMPIKAEVAGTVAGSSGRVDLRKLDAAIQALSKWEGLRGIQVPEEKRSAVIAILYDILVSDEGLSEDRMETVFRVLG